MPQFAWITGAAPGLSFADPYALGLLFLGLAIAAAIGALTHQNDRAFSASLIYLGIGLLAAVGVQLLGLDWIDPLRSAETLERASELAVIIALFGTGLKLDRPLRWRAWHGVVRLLAIAMPLTIAAVALLGVTLLGLSVGAAIMLGAILAPTDPVLAGDVGVGPPQDEEGERDANFSLTGEAGLNDGLAFPFLLVGAALIAGDPGGLVQWALTDVLYAVAVAVLVGAGLGYGCARLGVSLRDRRLLSDRFDGWAAIAAVLVIYGATEALSAYGFIAAFAGGLAFRRYERGHEYNQGVHQGAQTAEHFGELALVLVLGSTVSLEGLATPGPLGWLLVLALLVVIRPAAALVSLVGSGLAPRERAFVAWFGIRGIGSIYYAAVAVGLGVLSSGEAALVFWTMAIAVISSIVVHGVSATPLEQRWLERAGS